MKSNSGIIYGSVKNKIVASDLIEERNNRDFEIKGGLLYKNIDFYANFDQLQEFDKFMENDPILRNSHHFYEMSREEQMHTNMKKLSRAYQLKKKEWFQDIERFKNLGVKYMNEITQGGMMAGLHFYMFIDSLMNFSTPE